MKTRPLPQRLWYETARTFLHLTNLLTFRVRYSGRENVPLEGGVLVVSNHQSHLDPPVIGLGCPRQLNFLARKTLFDVPVVGKLIKSLGSVPIDRDGLGLGGVKESLKRLKRGETLLMFPEGTRTRDGEIAPFRPGFGTLAIRSGAYVLPVAIEGAYDCWPRDRKYPKIGSIRVHYGEPMLPEDVKKMEERELLAEVERRVRECHARLRESWAKRPT